MSTLQSSSFGGLPQDIVRLIPFKTCSSERFVKDVVTIVPSREPYTDIARANKLIAEGKSLFLDAMQRQQNGL